MSRFEKVSKAEYLNAMNPADNWVDEVIHDYENIQLPERKTSGSAGYDFISPADYMIGRTPVLIPTGIRCKLDMGKFLMIVPRSSMGFKYGMRLVNTAGIIDGDYYNSSNEGHIMIKVVSDTPFKINAGDRFAQGIIVPYYLSENGNNDAVRDGGFGSTGQ